MTAASVATLGQGGPYFDDLEVGLRLRAPGVSLTPGLAGVHQSIVGDRLRLALDHDLSTQVLGTASQLAHPALVWDLAIGQSTLLTRRVKANLFYRGLAFSRAPVLGDTLHTTTEVVGLRQNRPRADRAATGMVVLRIRTVDQHERLVLDFWRCAMLPLRDPSGETGHEDDFAAVPAKLDLRPAEHITRGWDLRPFAAPDRRVGSDFFAGDQFLHAGGDVVSSAPELARLTLNVASVHHDVTVSGRRLVYGGHAIGIAAAQVTRVLPDLVTILAWHSCDHTGPVYEGDTLHSSIVIERIDPLATGGRLVHLRSVVRATSADAENRTASEVLDWRLVGLVA